MSQSSHPHTSRYLLRMFWRVILLATVALSAWLALHFGRPLWLAAVERLGQSAQPVGLISNSIMMASTGLALLTLILAWAENRWRRPEALVAAARPQTLIWAWLAAFALLAALAAGVIWVGNPRGMYPTHFYPPRWLLVRPQKLAAYQNLSITPDVAILGSSRAFTISPAYIREKLGYSAFNAASEGARLPEFAAFLRFMAAQHDRTLPKVLMIESPPYLAGDQFDPYRMPNRLLPYLDAADAWSLAFSRYESLFDLDHFSEAAYNMMREPTPTLEWTFQPDGEGFYPSNDSDLANLLDQAIAKGPPSCQLPSPKTKADYEALVSLAARYQSAIIFFITPAHPRYYDEYMNPGSKFDACRIEAVRFLDDFAQRHANVFFLDYGVLDRIGGSATAEGFIDHQHLARFNADRLIDAAAETVRAAYAVAAEARQP
jgi:hypothetical protein